MEQHKNYRAGKNVVAMPIYQVVFPILARKFGESQIIGVEAVKNSSYL